MAWTGSFTFDGDLSSPLQMVRSLIGDVDSSQPKLWDELIAPLLPGGANGQANAYYAAAMAAGMIANWYAGKPRSVGDGGSSVTYGDRAKEYRDLQKSLRADGARLGGAVPWVGGVSRAGKAATESETDRVTPAFTRSLGDDPTAATGYDDGAWS